MRVFIDEPLNVKAWKTPLEAIFFFFIQSTHVFSVFFGATVHVFPNFEYIVIHLKRQGQGEECLVMPELMALLLFQMMRNSFYSPKPC